MTPIVKRKAQRGDRLLEDYTIEIRLRGTDKVIARIKPEYVGPMIGPTVSFYRVNIDGSEEHAFTLGIGGCLSIIRWLPLTINAARRLESRSRAKSPQQA